MYQKLQKSRFEYKNQLTAFNRRPIAVKRDHSADVSARAALTLKYKVYRAVEWSVFDSMRTMINGFEIIDYRFASRDFV